MSEEGISVENFIKTELPKRKLQALTINRAYELYKEKRGFYSFPSFVRMLDQLFKSKQVNREKTSTTYLYYNNKSDRISVRREFSEKATDVVLRNLPSFERDAITARKFAERNKNPKYTDHSIISAIHFLFYKGRINRKKSISGGSYLFWQDSVGVHYHDQEEVTPSRMQDIQLLVAGIQRAGYNVDPYVYGELASLEAQYISWRELSDTYIISPNSAIFYTYKDDSNLSKDTIAVSKSLTDFLEELSGMQSENAIDVLAHLKTGTPMKAKEILRIANDEIVVKRIKEGRIPPFSDSIWTLLFNALEIFHPTIITKPPFLQWFIAQLQLGTNPDITQRKVSAMKTHRLKNLIEYDEKAQKQEKKHLPGYHAVVYPLIQMNSSSQQDILARIKAAEEEIAKIHKRYEKVEKIFQEKELSGKLQKLEQQKDIEQRKLNLLEERLKKWNAEEAKVNKDILR